MIIESLDTGISRCLASMSTQSEMWPAFADSSEHVWADPQTRTLLLLLRLASGWPLVSVLSP